MASRKHYRWPKAIVVFTVIGRDVSSVPSVAESTAGELYKLCGTFALVDVPL